METLAVGIVHNDNWLEGTVIIDGIEYSTYYNSYNRRVMEVEVGTHSFGLIVPSGYEFVRWEIQDVRGWEPPIIVYEQYFERWVEYPRSMFVAIVQPSVPSPVGCLPIVAAGILLVAGIIAGIILLL